jgi:hypothetical protein
MCWPTGAEAGVKDWHNKLKRLFSSSDVGGIEWLAVVTIHLLHITTVSGWLKFMFDPTVDKPTAQERWTRDRVIEGYVVFELVVLQVLLWLPGDFVFWRCLGAAYILYEIFLNLSSIVFVGKFDVYPPTLSIERSLLLFGFNAVQVIAIFAIFYRAKFDSTPFVALIDSFLVFGTIGHPLDQGYSGGAIVALQIMCDFVLLAVFLGAFVGNLHALKRK